MAIFTTVNESSFRDAFEAYGRSNQFSYEGLGELFSYLDENNESLELDVISLCCEYAESTTEELIAEYSLAREINMLDDDCMLLDLDSSELAERVYEWLSEQTLVIGQLDNGSFLYQQF